MYQILNRARKNAEARATPAPHLLDVLAVPHLQGRCKEGCQAHLSCLPGWRGHGKGRDSRCALRGRQQPG